MDFIEYFQDRIRRFINNPIALNAWDSLSKEDLETIRSHSENGDLIPDSLLAILWENFFMQGYEKNKGR